MWPRGRIGRARALRTTMDVSVSSPGDCNEERDLVEAVIAEVNGSEAASEARIVLRAVRRENLPAGETVERDNQGRIDDLPLRAASIVSRSTWASCARFG